jgi:predicted transcriptional regulator/N-acetylglutamate synthase-like GNAT family acetyltransferase
MWKDFHINSEIKIATLAEEITNGMYQHDLKRLVEIVDDKYPGIDIWFKKKVLPGLKEKERFAYLVYHKNNPIGSAIIKKGEEAKLCSMRIAPEYEQKGIGSLLISLMGREIRNYAGKVHFTAPESTYIKYKSFFDNWGFKCTGQAGMQYRLFDKELFCEADAQELWKKVLQNLDKLFDQFTLVGNPQHPDIVMSIKPEYADEIKKKNKKVEIRRKFNKKWEGAYAMLYASRPAQEFFGEARISKVVEDSPKEIWGLFNSDLGVDKDKFFQYCYGVETVSALVLSDIEIFRSGILKSQIEFLINDELKPPQSYFGVKENTNWPTTALLSYLLLA